MDGHGSAAMANMNGREPQSVVECVTVLKQALHCLDEVLPRQVPEDADRFALAATYLQQVIDLLD